MSDAQRISVSFNDEKLVGWIQRDLRKTWIHFEGETFLLEDLQSKGKKSKSVDEESPEIRAPMPGRITKVLVATGEEVAAGQVVVMMEAMKMEYSLKAKRAGVIAKLNCTVGDSVSLGQTLIDINPAQS